MTIPNWLTLSRILLIPLFLILTLYQRFAWALVVASYCGITDFVDGYVARRFNQESELGRFLDPLGDKLLVATAFVLLCHSKVVPDAIILKGEGIRLGYWVTVAVISRDVLIVLGLILIYILQGQWRIEPNLIGKWTLFAQLVLLLIVLLANALGIGVEEKWITGVSSVVVVLTVLSGLSYVWRGSRTLNGRGEQKEGEQDPSDAAHESPISGSEE